MFGTTAETLSVILSGLTLLGVLFAIYKYFREPDIAADKTIALLKGQLETEKKISAEAIRTIQNHLKEIDATVNNQRSDIKDLCVSVAKLGTIIDERIPKRND